MLYHRSAECQLNGLFTGILDPPTVKDLGSGLFSLLPTILLNRSLSLMASPMAFDSLKNPIVFLPPPFAHWELLATSGMVDPHAPPRLCVNRPPRFPTLVLVVCVLQLWTGVVMEMLRPVPRFWVLAS